MDIDSSRQTTQAARKIFAMWLFYAQIISLTSQNLSRKVGGVDAVNQSAGVIAKKQRCDMYQLNVNNGVLFSLSSSFSANVVVVLVAGLQK